MRVLTDPGAALSDEEIDELAGYLERLPAHRHAFGVEALDGFLAAVLLYPEPVSPTRWLPYVFDTRGRQLESPWTRRETELFIGLVMRRYNELAYAIAEREGFDPIVFHRQDAETGEPLLDARGVEALSPWATGFAVGSRVFGGLRDVDRPGLASALLGILRFAPDALEGQADLQADIDALAPARSVDEAIEQVVESVLAIADLTRPRRPLRRAAPKVGRNERCPCGSGRKFKLCCGASVH